MNTKIVSIKQSNGVLRGLMNSKLDENFKGAIKDISSFKAKDVVGYKSLDQFSFKQADKVLNGAINKYLAIKDKDPKAMSSVLGQMSGTTFQNLRIYRDIVYTKQNREQRLLSALKSQLYKAAANANEERGTAYI